jgi:hypothetical protein
MRKKRANAEEKMRKPTPLSPGESETKELLQGKALARRDPIISNLPVASFGIHRLFVIDSQRASSIATNPAPTERHNRK